MPPNERCPYCHVIVEDWHVEWYKTEAPLLYQGLASMDCPLCGQPVGFQYGMIGPAPAGASLVRRYVDKAAEWAASQAASAGKSLQGYVSTTGAGAQYAHYWSTLDIQQADADENAKKRGPRHEYPDPSGEDFSRRVSPRSDDISVQRTSDQCAARDRRRVRRYIVSCMGLCAGSASERLRMGTFSRYGSTRSLVRQRFCQTKKHGSSMHMGKAANVGARMQRLNDRWVGLNLTMLKNCLSM
jgi:hypothetical protein